MNIINRCGAAFVAALVFSTSAAESPQKAEVSAAYEQSRQHLAAGDMEAAVAAARQAYELSRDVNGANSLTTATLGYNYSLFLSQIGSRQRALSIIEQSLPAYEAVHGENSVELIPALLLQGDLRNQPAAAQSLHRALAIQRAANPPDPLALARVAADVGALLAVRSETPDEAVDILKEALAIYDEEPGKDAPQMIAILMSLGDTQIRMANQSGARRYYKRALKLADGSVTAVELADLQALAGRRLLQLSDKRGKSYLESAQAVYLQELGPNDVKTAVTLVRLARHDLANRKYTSAKKRLLPALDVFSANENYRNYELKTLAMLVTTYESLGRRDEATPYCQAIGRITPFTPDQEYRPLVKVAPDYPPSALRKGREGEVIVEFTVDENGFAQSPSVVESTGGSVFHEPALAAVEKFRYAPRFVDGVAVATPHVQNRLTFSVEK